MRLAADRGRLHRRRAKAGDSLPPPLAHAQARGLELRGAYVGGVHLGSLSAWANRARAISKLASSFSVPTKLKPSTIKQKLENSADKLIKNIETHRQKSCPYHHSQK